MYKEYPGYISAWNAVDVVARVSGYLLESLPAAGSVVHKGDLLYGGTPADRLYLHADAIRFRHPMTGKEVEIKSITSLPSPASSEP